MGARHLVSLSACLPACPSVRPRVKAQSEPPQTLTPAATVVTAATAATAALPRQATPRTTALLPAHFRRGTSPVRVCGWSGPEDRITRPQPQAGGVPRWSQVLPTPPTLPEFTGALVRDSAHCSRGPWQVDCVTKIQHLCVPCTVTCLSVAASLLH